MTEKGQTGRYKPGYLKLHTDGELAHRIELLNKILSECRLCPRKCKVNRFEDERGVCRTGRQAVVSSYSPHFGEESPLVGRYGSGTIFFTHCNLLCIFCQNFDISHLGEGVEVTDEQLASIMIDLQRKGCHNINFVTPTHVVPQIVSALPLAIEKGLNIPLVYNSSGYDSVETLKLLEGIIDIYMPDFKFWNKTSAKNYCKAPDYPEKARAAIKEMHRQAGDLEMDHQGVATKGLLIRHLVMPEGTEETREIMHFLADEISMQSYVNVMEQYRPCGKAHQHPPLNRSLRNDEYEETVQFAKDAGLVRLDERNIENLLRRLRII